MELMNDRAETARLVTELYSPCGPMDNNRETIFNY